MVSCSLQGAVDPGALKTAPRRYFWPRSPGAVALDPWFPGAAYSIPPARSASKICVFHLELRSLLDLDTQGVEVPDL